MAAALPFVMVAMSVVGALTQASAAKESANYNQRVAEQNSVVARQQATEAERLQRITAAKQMGAMRAGFGASGVQTEGTPLDVLEESASAAEYDALNIRYKGEISANGYQNTAGLENLKGNNAMSAGLAKAGGSIAGGYQSYGSSLLSSGSTSPVSEASAGQYSTVNRQYG